MFKKIAILSFVANILFVLAAGYVVYSKGGVPFLMNFITAKLVSAESENGFDPYYNTKLTIFEDDDKEIVMLGDSLTDNNDWASSFPSLSISNQGISSDTTDGVLYRTDLATASEPEKLFLMIGVNDLIRGKSKEDVFKDYKKVIEDIQSNSPNTEIFIQSLLPINTEVSILRIENEDIAWINNHLVELAKEKNLTYIDLFSVYAVEGNELDSKWTLDGIHLNGDAYQVWETELKKYLN